MPRPPTDDELAALAEETAALAEFLSEPPPEDTAPLPTPAPWWPDLNPTQRDIFNDPARFILADGEKGCLPLDAQIYLDDRLTRLEALKPSTAHPGSFSPIEKNIWSFDGSKLTTAAAKAYWSEASDEAIRIELSHGDEITGSPRHPIWTCWQHDDQFGFGWHKLSEIRALTAHGWRFWTPLMAHPSWTSTELISVPVLVRPSTCKICGKPATARGLCASHYQNQVVYHGEAHPLIKEELIPITPELAYTLGALTGDGGLSQLAIRIGFTNADPECIAAVNIGLSCVGSVLAQVGERSYQYNILRPTILRQILRRIQLVGRSYDKRIPGAIIASPKSVVAAFLSGLFDTDGTVDKTGNVQFCTTSENLGLDVQRTLAAFGILCIRRRRKSASGKPTWTLSLHGENALLFGKEIGFKITRKQHRIVIPRFSSLCPNGFNPNRYGYPQPICAAMKSIALASRSVPRTRQWHHDHAFLRSYKSIPSRHKVSKFCAVYNCADKLSQFRISDHWVEVTSADDAKIQLADLHVPETGSFLASGTINHNSGKGIGCLHKLVRHSYDTRTAESIIITLNYNVGGGGPWADLLRLVLPAWRDGNRYPDYMYEGTDPNSSTPQLLNSQTGNLVPHPRGGIANGQGLGDLMDRGINLEFTEPRLDAKTKCSKLWIHNRYGGWNLVILLSIPFAVQIENKIKGLTPSFVFMDELTNFESRDYFKFIGLQLSRRAGLGGVPQQLVAAANPAGPSHWVYKVWWEEALAAENEPGKLCPDGLRRKPQFSRYHVRLTENRHRIPIDYVQQMRDTIGTDLVDRARLEEGQWVDRALGKSLYGDYWVPAIHVKPAPGSPEARRGIGIAPSSVVPIMIGYDPGPVNFSVHFEQFIGSKDKGVLLVIFDELNFVGQYVPYPRVVRAIMLRMRYWNDGFGPFHFEHIADEASFNQVRSDGKFDYQEIERLSAKWCAEHPESKLSPIKLKPCPKGNDSVPARTRMLIGMMQQETLLVSAICLKTIEAFTMLECEDEKFDKNGAPKKYDPLVAFRPKRSIYVHPNDSATYAPFYFTSTNAKYGVPVANVGRVYECGTT
jgi:hypothetical protein